MGLEVVVVCALRQSKAVDRWLFVTFGFFVVWLFWWLAIRHVVPSEFSPAFAVRDFIC